MIEEKLKEYVSALDNTESKRFLNLKRELLSLSLNDKELAALLTSIEGQSKEMSQNMINKYLSSKELEKAKGDKETISKVFGVDVSEVEHRKLNSGRDVFAFYDSNYSRKRVLENPIEGESLIEQLKRIQNENKEFQGANDYKSNTNDIMRDQANKLDYELQMIYIDDIYNYQMIIDGLNEEERVAFDYLLKQKDTKNIKYINIENCFALDREGNMIESFIDKDTNKPRIENPRKYKYQFSEIDNEEEVYDNDKTNTYNEKTETIEISYDDLEDIPDLIEAELLDVYGASVSKEQIKEISNSVINYYKNPDQMISLKENQRAFYEKFVNMLSEKIGLKRSQNKSNQQVLRNDLNTNGFSSTILLSIVIIIVCIVIVALMIK
ncbi:MAG: hypothetical protein J6J17_01390 [Bacilli bacterium]|nr:hypothetical protein [Bacilli bacterium]